MMPVWQRMIAPYVNARRLSVLAVVQEQHPDRARLYRQWRGLRWPIAVDALNLLGHKVVPVMLAIDEGGVVVGAIRGPRDIQGFLARRAVPPVAHPAPARAADVAALKRRADGAMPGPAARAYRDLGDAQFLAGNYAGAVDAYERAAALDPSDGPTQFRHGVALRRRSETAAAKLGDAQSAVAAWGRALKLDPNQYIWRRRIQQYGPRLAKPYNFYFWIDQARRDIAERGERPVPLRWEPAGSEIAAPRRAPDQTKVANPDPAGKLTRDTGLVRLEVVVTPERVQPGKRVRVRLRLRVAPDRRAYWNNESQPTLAWIGTRAGVAIEDAALRYAGRPTAVESTEPRLLECELAIPATATGTITLPGYALYDVCEGPGGVCRRLRQDFQVRIKVDPGAVKIGK